jgi:hypothetical protein
MEGKAWEETEEKEEGSGKTGIDRDAWLRAVYFITVSVYRLYGIKWQEAGNDELEKIWKESYGLTEVPIQKIRLEGLRENTKNLIQDRYCLH